MAKIHKDQGGELGGGEWGWAVMIVLCVTLAKLYIVPSYLIKY